MHPEGKDQGSTRPRSTFFDLGDHLGRENAKGVARLAKEALTQYEEKLLEWARRSRDPDQGFREKAQVEALKEGFEKLEKAQREMDLDSHVFNDENSPDQVKNPFDRAARDLVVTARDLQNLIFTDLSERINSSKADYNISAGIVMSTSVLAVLVAFESLT